MEEAACEKHRMRSSGDDGWGTFPICTIQLSISSSFISWLFGAGHRLINLLEMVMYRSGEPFWSAFLWLPSDGEHTTMLLWQTSSFNGFDSLARFPPYSRQSDTRISTGYA